MLCFQSEMAHGPKSVDSNWKMSVVFEKCRLSFQEKALGSTTKARCSRERPLQLPATARCKDEKGLLQLAMDRGRRIMPLDPSESTRCLREGERRPWESMRHLRERARKQLEMRFFEEEKTLRRKRMALWWPLARLTRRRATASSRRTSRWRFPCPRPSPSWSTPRRACCPGRNIGTCSRSRWAE